MNSSRYKSRFARRRDIDAYRHRDRTRNGFTLLEVVLGLILMATVLASSLLSFSAHRRQLVLADKRMAAVTVADQLLGNMAGGNQRLPRSTIGPIMGQPNWYWQTSVVALTRPMQAPLVVIRLSIVERRDDGTQQVLTSVDVVEPLS